MLLRGIISLVLNAVALIAVAQIFDSFQLDGFGTALLASVILAILNMFVKPILVILTLPITVITFGLFLIVVNAIILMITQALIGPAFVIDGFGTAFIASIVISLISMILNSVVRDIR